MAEGGWADFYFDCPIPSGASVIYISIYGREVPGVGEGDGSISLVQLSDLNFLLVLEQLIKSELSCTNTGIWVKGMII